MNRVELAQRVKDLGPWHYCHIFEHPDGPVSTGSSMVPVQSEKLLLMAQAGAFPRTEYPMVLDLGANSGLISMWFVDNKNSRVVAVESGAKYYPQLEFAIKTKGYDRIEPWKWDITKGKYGEDEFDLVLFLGTMHHIAANKHSAIFKASYNSLVSGGSIAVQTVGTQPVMKRLKAAGFVDRRQLPYSQGDRLAWTAKKP